MLTYTAFRDAVEALVQDSSNANFSAAELDTFIAQACREAGRYVPHVVQVSFNIESRTGTATSTTASALVDATESQFVSTDTDKVIYNTTDKTWAVVTAYVSATQLTLSKNIMASGENYEIYNAGCTQKNQISLSSIDDYLDVERVEYPVGTPRNWEINGNVLTVKVDYVADSKVLTSGTQPDTEVIVWFKKRHLISQLTDLAGAVNNAPGYSAGDTSMAINSIQASGTIETGQEFTLADTRGTYTVTADATISGNAATISFFPGLESAVANAVGVTFTRSTLTPTLEPLVEELAAALACVSKPLNPYQQVFSAVTAVGLTTTAIADVAARITQAVADIASGRTEAGKVSAILDTANTELDKIGARLTQVATDIGSARTDSSTAATAITTANTQFDLGDAQVDLAVTALSSGNSLLNTVPIGGGASEYMGQAQSDINVANGFISTGKAYIEEMQGDLSKGNLDLGLANGELGLGRGYHDEAQGYIAEGNTRLNENASYLQSAAKELQSAQVKAQEGQASLSKAATLLQIARTGEVIEAWGRAQLKEVRTKLRNLVPRKYLTSRVYSRD